MRNRWRSITVFVWLMLFSDLLVRGITTPRAGVWRARGDCSAYHHDLHRQRLISQFDWILYIFGAFLPFTGVKMALAHEMNQALATSRRCAGYACDLRMTDTISTTSISLCVRMDCCTPHR
ncbi:hypothetical protein ACNKHT_20225 [Shigella flexneri]